MSKQFSGVIKTTLVDLEKSYFIHCGHTFANFFKQRGLQNDFFRYLFGHTLSNLASWPGKPQQNGSVERYKRTVRYGWLNQHLLESLEEIQGLATRWLWKYNNEHPNLGVGGITPAMKLKQAA